MTIHEALKEATQTLQPSCPRPRFEAELLLSYHLHRPRHFLAAYPDATVPDLDAYRNLVARRAAFEPYEYIVGSASFYDIELYVAPGVLIPRPETELLVDKAAEIIAKHNLTSVIEVGIGSGAISIMLARTFPQLRITATDISPDALSIARRNIERYGLQERITLMHTDLLDGVESAPLVVSNPPYIADDAPLDANVKAYEPHQALFGGEKGDELLKRLIDEVHARRIPFLTCETGYDQKASLAAYVARKGDYTMTFYNDLAGLNRGFVMERTDEKK